MFKRIKVITLLVSVLLVLGAMQIISARRIHKCAE